MLARLFLQCSLLEQESVCFRWSETELDSVHKRQVTRKGQIQTMKERNKLGDKTVPASLLSEAGITGVTTPG